MNAVERITYFCGDYVDQEGKRSTGVTDESWPSHGAIEFDDLSLTYSEPDELVLKSLSASISAKEKIGVVGRTGAGKSTLMGALFRLLEAADGSITIDGEGAKGQPISKIGLTELRSKLAIIPQDPVIFSGTVRTNLDPFAIYAADGDEVLWAALETVHLKDSIKAKAGGLDHEVKENGDNFSMGEKQVLCLARALLRTPKILLMDEATASVDWDTDRLIQGTVRTTFKDSTVLVIAHRLNTIIDSDKVMVLAKGELLEFDTPANLLRDSSSYFAGMVAEMGESVAASLTELALQTERSNKESAAAAAEAAAAETAKGDAALAPADVVVEAAQQP